MNSLLNSHTIIKLAELQLCCTQFHNELLMSSIKMQYFSVNLLNLMKIKLKVFNLRFRHGTSVEKHRLKNNTLLDGIWNIRF